MECWGKNGNKRYLFRGNFVGPDPRSGHLWCVRGTHPTVLCKNSISFVFVIRNLTEWKTIVKRSKMAFFIEMINPFKGLRVIILWAKRSKPPPSRVARSFSTRFQHGMWIKAINYSKSLILFQKRFVGIWLNVMPKN